MDLLRTLRRPFILPCLLALLFCAPCAASAQTPAPALPSWLVTADFYGTLRYMRLGLDMGGSPPHARLNGVGMTGSLQGTKLHLAGHDESGATTELDATLENGTLKGTVNTTDPHDTPTRFSFRAEKLEPLGHPTPKTHEFTPTIFYRQFSPFYPPVLHIHPGDTVHTTTVDAGGNDEKSQKRVAGGNPQTGPFYIDGAMPGDVLVVHILHLRLNRDWAGSDDSLVESAKNSHMAIRMRGAGNSVRWHLDREHGVAYSESPGEHLKALAVPLRPMLGCLATATGPVGAPPGTGDSGFFGGNMDFNGMAEGTTLYLPVSNPGALLHLGDGHAAMGDGELTGNALETSMDVEFSVDVLRDQHFSGLRLEDANSLMTMGLYGSLDDAFKEATSVMGDWLAVDYKLTPSETAQVLGTLAEYHVSEVADRNSGVVLRLPKRVLMPAKPPTP